MVNKSLAILYKSLTNRNNRKIFIIYYKTFETVTLIETYNCASLKEPLCRTNLIHDTDIFA